MVEEGDGVTLAIDGCAFSKPWEVARFFRVGVCAGEDVGGGGGIDAHGGSELETGMFGIAVEFGVAGDCGDDGRFVDLHVAVGSGLGDDERAGFVEEGGAFGGFPEDARFEGGGFVGGFLGEELFVDLVSTFHVPPIKGTSEAIDGYLHPPDVDAAVVREAASGTLRDGGGARGIHDVQKRFVGFVQTLRRTFVMCVLVPSESLAFEEDVEVIAGGVRKGVVSCVCPSEAEEQGGKEEGVGFVHGIEGG